MGKAPRCDAPDHLCQQGALRLARLRLPSSAAFGPQLRGCRSCGDEDKGGEGEAGAAAAVAQRGQYVGAQQGGASMQQYAGTCVLVLLHVGHVGSAQCPQHSLKICRYYRKCREVRVPQKQKRHGRKAGSGVVPKRNRAAQQHGQGEGRRLTLVGLLSGHERAQHAQRLPQPHLR